MVAIIENVSTLFVQIVHHQELLLGCIYYYYRRHIIEIAVHEWLAVQSVSQLKGAFNIV